MTKANILIIDDEVDLCQSLLELLEEEKYKVFIAHSGKEGLIKVKENLLKNNIIDKSRGGNHITVLVYQIGFSGFS